MNTTTDHRTVFHQRWSPIWKLPWIVTLVCFACCLCGGARDLEDESVRRLFSVVAFNYKAMPERFERFEKLVASLPLDPNGKQVWDKDRLSYTTKDHHFRVYMVANEPRALYFFVRAMESGKHDMAVLIQSPDDMTPERVKTSLEWVCICAQSSVESPGHPLNELGGIDSEVMYRDFGKEPMFQAWAEMLKAMFK